ncbi:gas vesicle protein GvpO [Kitasatospora sp. NPDC085895]|uniref:gas vesicle protein GvpO n=1 Tax=Kitasatospora sp. NPDC085895 TaxID=3155057 RepID=UPI00344CB963
MPVRRSRPTEGDEPERPIERRSRRTPPADPPRAARRRAAEDPPDNPEERPVRRRKPAGTSDSGSGADEHRVESVDGRSRGAPQEETSRSAPASDESEERPVRRRAGGTADPRGAGEEPRRRPAGGKLTARRAAAVAADDVDDLTGRTPEGITSIDRTEDGWRIGVEVLESRRVPDSADILAVYLVALDDDGDLISYRRERRYYRGRPEEDSS